MHRAAEIRVQRVHHATLDGGGCGAERLPQHLPPNTEGRRWSRLSPRNRLTSELLEARAAPADRPGVDPWGAARCALAVSPNLKVPCISALWPGKVHRYGKAPAFLRIEVAKVTLVVSPPRWSGVREHALVTRRQVVIRQPRAHAAVATAVTSAALTAPSCVPSLPSELADVVKRDRDVLTGRRCAQLRLVVLHQIRCH